MGDPQKERIKGYKQQKIDENVAPTDEISIDNPLGGTRRGAQEPVFSSLADIHVEFWDYTMHQAEDAFGAAPRDRGTYRDGNTVKKSRHPHDTNIQKARRSLTTDA